MIAINEEIIDYTEEIHGCVAAEGRGKEVLILRKLETPVQRVDREYADYVLEYCWLSGWCENSGDQAWACVQGNEFSYWKQNEISPDVLDGRTSLFDEFRLFA